MLEFNTHINKEQHYHHTMVKVIEYMGGAANLMTGYGIFTIAHTMEQTIKSGYHFEIFRVQTNVNPADFHKPTFGMPGSYSPLIINATKYTPGKHVALAVTSGLLIGNGVSMMVRSIMS